MAQPQLFLLQINNESWPNEGPVLFSVTIPWGTLAASGYNPDNVYTINAQQQSQSGRFSRCQGVFVNNTSSPYQLQIRSNETGCVLTIPPFSQGTYPLFCAANPSFVVTQVQSFTDFQAIAPLQTTTYLAFLNVAVLPWTQEQPPSLQATGGTSILTQWNGGGETILKSIFAPAALLTATLPTSLVLYSISMDFYQPYAATSTQSYQFALFEGTAGTKAVASCLVPFSTAGAGQLMRTTTINFGPNGYVFVNQNVGLYGRFAGNDATAGMWLFGALSYGEVVIQ